MNDFAQKSTISKKNEAGQIQKQHQKPVDTSNVGVLQFEVKRITKDSLTFA